MHLYHALTVAPYLSSGGIPQSGTLAPGHAVLPDNQFSRVFPFGSRPLNNNPPHVPNSSPIETKALKCGHGKNALCAESSSAPASPADEEIGERDYWALFRDDPDQWDKPSTRRLLQDSATSVCKAIGSGLKTVADICSQSIRYPTGASLKQCSRRISVPDDCASKQKFKYPCTKGLCDGWTCVPGTKDKDVSYPCGIEIDYRDVNVCGKTENLRDKIDRAQGVCSCLGNLSGDILRASQSDDGSGDEAVSRAMRAHADAIACMTESIGKIQSNRDAAMENLKNTEDHAFVVLPKIRLGMYIDLAQRIGVCAITGKCSLLVSQFTDYLMDASESVREGYGRVMATWLNPLNDALGSLSDAKEKLDSITSSDMDEITSCVADKVSSETASQITRTINNLKTLFTTADELVEAQRTAEKLSSTISTMVDSVAAISSSLSGNNADAVSRAVQNGGKLADVFHQALTVQELGTLSSTVQKIGQSIPEAQKYLANAMSQIKDIEGTSAVSCIETGPLADALQALSRAYLQINNLRVRSIQMDAGIQTYNRWADLSMDVPCTRTGRKCFTVAGQSSCANYPEVYACPFQQRVPFPNEHIPYLRFRFI